MSKFIFFLVLTSIIISACENTNNYVVSEEEPEWEKFSYAGNQHVAIFALDEDHVWIYDKYGKIIFTKDGGLNWEMADLKLPAFNHVKLQFSDTLTGWVNVEQFFLKTTDGGFSWNKIAVVNPVMEKVNNFHFFDENNGIAIMNSNIYKTSDGGIIWEHQGPAPCTDFKSFCFNGNLGWILSSWQDYSMKYNTDIFITKDSGLSWQNIYSYKSDGKAVKVQFIDEMTGWFFMNYDGKFTDSSKVIKTNNGGESWIEVYQDTNRFISDIFPVDKDYIWIIKGFTTYNVAGKFENSFYTYTKNGGESWKNLDILFNVGIADGFPEKVYFVNKDIGWAAGSHGYIAKTVTGSR